MGDSSRKIMKALADQINRSRLLYNATTAIGNATERAQERIARIQNLASERYNTIVKQVDGSTVIQNLQATPIQSSTVPMRIVDAWQWYQHVTGLDTIEMAKRQVMLVQEKLFKCQENRRELHRQAAMINESLKQIYAELIQTKRDDSKYVQLTIMENKTLQEQSRVTAQLNLLETEERDHFTQLATAIKEYHDSQAVNAQKYKYLSIIASALLTIASLIGSMIYNNKRIADVRTVISEAQEKNDLTFKNGFQTLEQLINTKFNQAAEINNSKILSYFDNVSGNDNNVEDSDEFYDIQKKIIYTGTIILGLYILGKIF